MKENFNKGHIKILGLILFIILLIGISSCYIINKDSNKPDEQIELTFYYPVEVGGHLVRFVENMSEEFTRQNPHIKVKPVYTGSYYETNQKLQKDMEEGTPPDLFVDLASRRFQMVESGLIEPLDDLIGIDEEEGKRYIDGFIEEFIKDSYVDGKIYGIPFQRSIEILYYNKDAFREVGLDPERPPENWSELISYSKKLTKKNRNNTVERWGVGIPLNIGAAQWTFGSFAMQNHSLGRNLMSDDGKKVYFNTSGNVEALQLWKDLQNKYQVMPETIIQWEDLPRDFLTGKYAMIYHTTGNLTNIYRKTKFDFGTANLPGNKHKGSSIGGGDIYITKGLPKEKQEAAWEFIKFVTSTPQVVDWAINTGYIATRKNAYQSKLLREYYKELPQAKIGYEQLEYAKPELATYQSDAIWKILSDNMQYAFDGQLEPADALERAQKQADRILDKYN